MAAQPINTNDVAEVSKELRGDAEYKDTSLSQELIKALPFVTTGYCCYKEPLSGVACGCRAYWLNTISPITGDISYDRCACGHHACFHSSNTGLGSNLGDGIAVASTTTLRNSGADLVYQLQEVGRLLS